MSPQDIRVGGVDQHIFKILLEKGIGVAHKILVKGVVQSSEETQRFSLAPPASSRLLPGAGNTARIAVKYRSLKATAVNTQFQGVGRHHSQQPAAEQLPLNLASFLREIACPIGLD